MSDCWFNLRILFWHIQGTTYGRWRFSFNRWAWKNKKAFSIVCPLYLYEFNLSRRSSTSLERDKTSK
jgi:hypothetical protein